jgi:hypothetical protein
MSSAAAHADESQSHISRPVLPDPVPRPRKTRQIQKRDAPPLPPDYPRAGRYGGRDLWGGAAGQHIPASTFVDWQRAGKIPKPDKVLGRTRLWAETTVHKTMAGE